MAIILRVFKAIHSIINHERLFPKNVRKKTRYEQVKRSTKPTAIGLVLAEISECAKFANDRLFI